MAEVASSLPMLHLSYPTTTAGGGQQQRAPLVTIHPVVLFAILDHQLRRTPEQERVIGTLLGVRTGGGAGVGGGGGGGGTRPMTSPSKTATAAASVIEIRNCFPVPHSETEEQVAVDMDYHRTMADLHQKVNPKEVIVGWYATGKGLNAYSALIQGAFYAKETEPYPAVHLTMDTTMTMGDFGVKTFVSTQIGAIAKPENCMFLPVPNELRFAAAERSGLDLLAKASGKTNRETSLGSDLVALEGALRQVLGMLERVSSYVRDVTEGKRTGDPVIGRMLLEVMSGLPNFNKAEIEDMFNTHLQDVLMTTYLANLIRTQLEIGARLNLLT